MRTVTFQSVLWGVARLLGLDPTRDLTSALAARLTAYINRAIAKAWRFEQWPEWTMTEPRWYRPFYADGTFVTAGDEVYFPASDKYYQALQNQVSASQAPALQDPSTLCWTENSAWWAESQARYRATDWTPNTSYGLGLLSNLPYQVRNPADGLFYQALVAHISGATFDPTLWGRLTPFTRVIDYEQAGQTKIWEAPNPCAFRRDPRVFSENPWPVRATRNDRGLLLEASAPNQIWIKFWTQPPQFTATPWNATAAYDEGALVYYSGDTFVSLLGNNTGDTPGTAAWGLVEFPFVLASYVTRMAYSDALRDQKQTDRAGAEQANAELELQDEADKALAAQGIYETATVETAPSPAIE